MMPNSVTLDMIASPAFRSISIDSRWQDRPVYRATCHLFSSSPAEHHLTGYTYFYTGYFRGNGWNLDLYPRNPVTGQFLAAHDRMLGSIARRPRLSASVFMPTGG
jgi:hypothetical protein